MEYYLCVVVITIIRLFAYMRTPSYFRNIILYVVVCYSFVCYYAGIIIIYIVIGM